MANNLLITLSSSEFDIYYTNPVAFDDWIQAIKITIWQITNAIIQYVDLRIRTFLIDCFLLFSFELRAEQRTTTQNWNNLCKAQDWSQFVQMLQTSPISSNSEAQNTITGKFAMDLSVHEVCHISKEINLFLLFFKDRDRLISILVSTRESQEGVIFTIWLSLFPWTKIEFNKEKRHLIGDWKEHQCSHGGHFATNFW